MRLQLLVTKGTFCPVPFDPSGLEPFPSSLCVRKDTSCPSGVAFSQPVAEVCTFLPELVKFSLPSPPPNKMILSGVSTYKVGSDCEVHTRFLFSHVFN